MNEFLYENIIRRCFCFWFIVRQLSLNKINDETCQLRLQHVEVIGYGNKENSNAKPYPVLPEIFIECS